MLPVDYLFTYAFAIGAASLAGFGLTMSYPPIWNRYFKSNGEVIGGVYLKAGEYGESELKSASVFEEPLNAWSSLSYSLYGFVICYVGLHDVFYNDAPKPTLLVSYPAFSVVYGLSALYLGIASFLFHASHSEIWRKADAGMTSGVVVPLFMMGLWDRARPIGVSSNLMVILTLVLQMSLTHGYLPYGSSDILLPSFVAIAWVLEMHPRYGGVMDSIEYARWAQCCFAVLVGVLLRLADIKRHSPKFFNNAFLGVIGLTLIFGYFLGFGDWVVCAGAVGAALVYVNPPRGHVCWHLASSFSMYIWWYSMRLRSGDPDVPFSADRTILCVALYIAVKNAFRRIFMAIPFSPDELRDRTYIIIEHVVLTAIGYYVLVVEPVHPKNSMLRFPALCWSSSTPTTDLYHFWYQIQVATRLEDVLFMAVKIYQDMQRVDDLKDRTRDVKMILHHIVTGVLCILSYSLGYSKIGALVLFLHDISDVPLDCLRIAKIFNWDLGTYVSYAFTLIFWVVWRLYYFLAYVIYSVAVDSTSVLYPLCVGNCFLQQWAERTPFLCLLGSLYALHVIWFRELVNKGIREFSGGGIPAAKAEEDEVVAMLNQKSKE